MAYRENCTEYRDISLIRRRLPLGPYSRLMPRALWEVLGGWALSHERRTPVYIRGLVPNVKHSEMWNILYHNVFCQETEQTSRRVKSVYNLLLRFAREWKFHQQLGFQHFSPPTITFSTSKKTRCTRKSCGLCGKKCFTLFERHIRPDLNLCIS